MATKTWTGASSTDWNDPNNWSLIGVPGSGDDVVIGSTANSPALSTSTTVNTITINGTDTLALSGVATILTATNGVTLSSTGGISGFGALAANVTASGAATIAATGGTLEIIGTITDSGNALVLSDASDRLLLDSASAAHTVTFGSSGTLELNIGATLTVGTAMAIGAGTLQLDGPSSTFTDASGVMINGGTIIGQGTVNADFGSTGTVTASGGTLHLAGAVASGPTLAIANVGGSVLSIENIAVAAAPIALNTNKKTLAIEAGGNLTINGGAESVTKGTITISAGGQLSDSAGFVIGDIGVLMGAGTVTGPISGSGIVKASGGTLELVTAIAASDGTLFEIASGAGARLLLDAAPGSGNTFTFLGNKGRLVLADDTGFSDTISGLNVGASGAKTNFVDIEGHTVTVTGVTGQGTTSGTITLSDGAVLNLSNLSSTAWFANAVGDGASGTDIFVSDTACYCRGTLILTEGGEVPVEELAIGDQLVTEAGWLRPIRWIGRRSYIGWLAAGNPKVLPICFKPGSLADRVPQRELWVSPEHAMYLDGVLVPAELLVNGISIVKAASVDEVHYFHLELETHDVICAEGAWAESFVDDDSRGMFHNAAEYRAFYPDAPLRAPAQYCAPRVEDGFELEALRRKLASRARRLRPDGTAPSAVLQGNLEVVTHGRISGWACDPASLQLPVALVIFADGAEIGRVVADHYRRDLEEAGIGDGHHAFELALPGGLAAGSQHKIEVCRTDDDTPIPGSPRVLAAALSRHTEQAA